MAMCADLLDTPHIVPTAFEGDLPSAYTAATLAFLKRRMPAVRFVWIMGADNLAGFHRWQQWRDIAASFPIAVIDRPTFRLRAMASPAAQALRASFVPETYAQRLALMRPPAWTVLSVRLSHLSSTALRNDPARSPAAQRIVDAVIKS